MNYLFRLLIVLVLLHGFSASAATPIEEFKKYHEKLINYQQDLLETGKNLTDFELHCWKEVYSIVSEYSEKLAHIRDLLLIESLIQSDADRQRVGLIIKFRLKAIHDRIENSVKMANIEIAGTKSPITAGIATKLRDDLREIRELLKSN